MYLSDGEYATLQDRQPLVAGHALSDALMERLASKEQLVAGFRGGKLTARSKAAQMRTINDERRFRSTGRRGPPTSAMVLAPCSAFTPDAPELRLSHVHPSLPPSLCTRAQSFLALVCGPCLRLAVAAVAVHQVLAAWPGH